MSSPPPQPAVPEEVENLFKKVAYRSSQGLKNSMHGNIYQLKLLMLYAYRGWKNGYIFRLATEMTEVGKFDDVVILYMDTEGLKFQCLQAKHSLDKAKTIRKKDLLDDGDKQKKGDYLLEKYFISYRQIKKYLEEEAASCRRDITLQACIIHTNIPLADDVPKKNISHSTDSDPFLPIKNSPRYQLDFVDDEKKKIYEKKEIYEKFRCLSDARLLAKELAQCFFHGNGIDITYTGALKYYHRAVSTHIIDWDKEKLRDTFVKCDPASREGQFKTLFLEECSQLSPESGDIIRSMNQRLGNTEIKPRAFPGFGVQFSRMKFINPDDVEEFSREFIKVIKDSQMNPNVIFVDRQKVAGKILGKNINKLLGNALKMQGKDLKFDPTFLEPNRLPDNLKKFRDCLKVEFGDGFQDLKDYKFDIRNPTPPWTHFQSTDVLPDPTDIIEDEEIADFFEKLVFEVSQPKEVELGDIIKKEILKDKKLNDREAAFVSNSFQIEMLDWFKKKGEELNKEGEYYNHEKVGKFFKSVLKKTYTLLIDSEETTIPEE